MTANPGAVEAVPVMIPKELYKEIENRVKLSKGTFKNVEEYVAFILTEVVREDQGKSSEGSGFTHDEEEEIKARLNKLGYI